MRRPLLAAFIVAACGLLLWQLAETSNARVLLGDFRAFYCGGSMVLHGVDPYAAGPLFRCEQAPAPFGLHSVREADLPAPFPGYALAAFAPFALLPYPVAAALWLIVLLAATVVSALFVSRLCGRPFFAGFTVLAVAFSVSVIPYGELAPVVLAALAGGALALRRGSRWGAFAALLVLALLPHVALPVFLAVFVWYGSMRVPIAAIAVLLALLDLAAGGPNLALAYFSRVLPDHAASEVGFVTQFSLTWLVQALGASDRVALAAGNISYIVMVAAGVWLSGYLASKLRDRAFLIVIPAALAVTGGSFIHYSEITLALPAALLLYVRTEGKPKLLAGIAVLLVALPWQSVVTQPFLIIPLVAGTIAIAAVVFGIATRHVLRAGLGAALFCAICILLAWHFGPQTSYHVSSRAFDVHLAEASWARHISTQISSTGIVWWVPKLPTWFGLVSLLASAVIAANKR